MVYEPNPYPSSYGPPPAAAAPAPAPPDGTGRRSPALGYIALGIAALNLLIGIGGQVVQRGILVNSHYSMAGYGLVSGAFTTIGILFDVAAIAVAIVAIVGRRGAVPAGIALGASAAGLLSALGWMLISLTMSFG